MGFDFHGIYLSGSIVTFRKEGESKDSKEERYELWTDPGQNLVAEKATGLVKELKSLAFVQEVTISIGMGRNSKVDVTLSPPFEEGIALINSRLLQWGVGQMHIQIGYSTGSPASPKKSAIFGGLMQKPDVKIGSDVTITLHALGVGYAMNLSGMVNPEHWPAGTTPAQAVIDVLNKYKPDGVQATGVSTEGIFKDFDQEARTGGHPFFRPVIQLVLEPAPPAPLTAPATFKSSNLGSKHKLEVAKLGTLYGADLLADRKQKADDDLAAREAEAAGEDRTPAEKKDLLIGLDENGNALTSDTGAVKFVPTKYVNNGADHINGANVFYLGIDQGPKNDWWFVYETCKNYGLELVVIDRNVFVRDADKWKKAGAVMEFSLRGNIDTNATVPKYPVLEFSSPSTAVWIEPGVGAQVLEDLNDNGQPEKIVVTDTETNITREGDTAYDPNTQTPTSTSPQEAGATIPGGVDSSAVREMAKAEYKNINNTRGIVAEVLSIGIPELEPGMIVGVTGLGGIYPGLYGVLEVEHKIGNGGFTTKWKGLSTSMPKDMTAHTKPSTGAQTPSVDQEESFRPGRVRVEPVPQADI